MRDFFKQERNHPDFGMKNIMTRAKLIRFMSCLVYPGQEATISSTSGVPIASSSSESEVNNQ